MIVKDEEHVIGDTLEKLVNQITFSYWVICDTGSTDKTREIITEFFKAKRIPGELLEHKWKDFGHNRTLALEGAYKKADYIFIFDADDTIHGTPVIPRKMTHDFYKMKFGEHFTYYRPLFVTAHKKSKFVGVLHEFLSLEEGRPTEGTIEGGYYIDSGKTGSRSRDKDKYLKDAMILKEAYKNEVDTKGGLAGRYAFYCAQSFKDCGRVDDSLEWYTLVADKLVSWVQEKYYACLMAGFQYKSKGDFKKALEYFLKAEQFDPDRTEGVFFACEMLKDAGLHTLVVLLYEKYKNYNKDPQDKLFLFRDFYNDVLEFNASVSAYMCNNRKVSYECSKQIILNNICQAGVRDRTFKNLRFHMNELSEDSNTLGLFYHLTNYIQTCDQPREIAVIWNLLFKNNRKFLTVPLKFKPNPSKKGIVLTLTSCKRLDLFTETVNSILNHWTDADQIDYWFCVDDNSSKEDRAKMKKMYPWINFYHKTSAEKGHRESMNIIWNMLKDTKPKYWIHMEDDFLFYIKNDYVTKSIKFLESQTDIKQVLFNRLYAETINDLDMRGSTPIAPGFVVQEYKNGAFPYKNCHYWPHYSFRPSMTVVSAILGIGNYDSPNTFFEMDYAKKWVNAGYKSAFFDMICCRHIGRLTSEIKNKTVKNAYELNNTNQFSASKAMKVVNLKRRADRREAMTEEFKKANFSDYVFIEAVDGKDLSPTNDLKKLFEGNDFGNRIGVIGCALTHYNLWKMLLAGREDYFIIFEDDVKLSPNFTTKLEAIKDAMKACDYLHLGYHMTSKNRKLHEDVYTKDTGKLTVTTLKKELYIGGTFAYSINKNGARILVDYIEKNGIKHGIDYVVKICNPLKNMEIQPQIAFSEWYEVPGQKVDTDIQTERASLDFKNIVEEEFEFFEGLDHIGDDICFEKLSVDECIKLAKTMPQCVGFNTLGFFKKAVDVKNLVKSQYFSPTDGIYVKTVPQKKPTTEVVVPKNNPIKVKMICNWEPSENFVIGLLKSTLLDPAIEITSSNEADYFLVYNFPFDGEFFNPQRTIVVQLEPWVHDGDKPWGIKTWGEWSNPDPTKFLHVRTHKNFLAPAHLAILGDLYNFPSKKNAPTIILSDKLIDTGHHLRVQFLKSSDIRPPVEVYGLENFHNLSSYVGQVPGDDRYNVYSKYKYVIAAENNFEHNYATEKIWEPLLCECLPFYWGCPNLEEYIDPQCFVRLPLEEPEKASEIIRKAIEEDWWSQRIDAIRAAKSKIINELSLFPIISKIIRDSMKTKAVILTLHSSKERIPIVEKLQSDLTNIGLENEVFYGVNGKDLITSNTKVVYNNEVMKYDPNVRLNGERMKIGEFGASWSHIKIYQKLVADENADNYLVLEDDAHVVGDLNILRDLPLDFDIAHVARSDMHPFVLTSQVNSSFFNIEKDYFNRLTGYVVSKAGAKKLLAVTDGYINVPCDDLLSNSFLRDQIRVIVPKEPIFDFPIDIQSTTDLINNSNN